MREFAVHYAVTKNATEACRLAGYSEKYAISKSHLLLKNAEVMEIVTNLSIEYYKNMFEQVGLTAIKNLSDVVTDSENRATQLSAIKYVLNVIGVTDKDTENGEIQIKIRLPRDLQH